MLHLCLRARRAVAAVEFALTFPVVLYLFAGVTDFGFVYYREVGLSTAVSAAAQFAELCDDNGNTVVETTVESVMRNAAAQSLPGVTPTATAACYCITTTTTSTTWNNPGSAIPCSSTCTGASSSPPTALKYLELTLTTTYNSFLPWSMVGSPTLTKTTWLPLQ